MKRWLAVLTTLTVLGCTDAPPPDPVLLSQQSGTTVRLQAVSAVDEQVVWASGVNGTVTRTTDGGQTWHTSVVPGADSLQFRDIDAVDANTAYLLSSGSGESSRIYKTTNAGRTWTLQFTNTDPTGFFDCLALWDSEHGAVYGDAVDGSIVILRTSDGETWNRVPEENLPQALPGEGGFAASGTCLVTYGDSTGWIGTGAGSSARVIKTTDRGLTWSIHPTPVVSGSGTSGLMTLGFHDSMLGIAAGGELSNPDQHNDNVVVTQDGGRTWTLAGRPVLPGAVYGLAVVPGAKSPTVVAVGPGGMDYSVDNGATWFQLDSFDYWSVAFVGPNAGWAVGPGGRITKIALPLPLAGRRR